MQITCIDQTDGRLFFAHDLISSLNNFEHETIFYLPERYSNLYGSLFEHFPHIKIKIMNELSGAQTPNLIFVNFNSLKNLQNFSKSLVYPILKNYEIDEFHHCLRKINISQSLCIMPLAEVNYDKMIVRPESLWTMDMLRRQINQRPLIGIKVLISAGPTIEDIDPVRYLTNRSSGKMGIALARAAYMDGADVQLILGPVNIPVPSYLSVHRIRSAEDMYNTVKENFEKCDIYIGSAAIADFTPANPRNDKIKKRDSFSELILQPTKDILKEISMIRKKQLLIGFSVETSEAIENSKSKLNNKNLDLVVVNNPKQKGAAFDAETNVVSVIHKDGRIESWPIMSKLDVAGKLMLIIRKLIQD